MDSMNDKELDNVFSNLQQYLMGEASEAFSDKVMEYAYDPVNVGEIKNPDVRASVKGDCGDAYTMFLKIKGQTIDEIRFLVDGCGASLACGCAITELARGITPYEAGKITPQAVIQFLDGLPASHLHCAVLAVQTLQKALDDLNKKSNHKK